MVPGGGGIYIGWLCPCAMKFIYSDSGACSHSPCQLISEQQFLSSNSVSIVRRALCRTGRGMHLGNQDER